MDERKHVEICELRGPDEELPLMDAPVVGDDQHHVLYLPRCLLGLQLYVLYHHPHCFQEADAVLALREAGQHELGQQLVRFGIPHVLEDEVLLDGLDERGVVVEIDEEMRIDEAVAGPSRPLGKSISLVEAFLVIESKLY